MARKTAVKLDDFDAGKRSIPKRLPRQHMAYDGYGDQVRHLRPHLQRRIIGTTLR